MKPVPVPTQSVLSVVSEVFPLIKTGGLADVAGALPAALAPEGIRMVTLVPGYPAVMAALELRETLYSFPDLFGGRADLIGAHAAGLDLLVIDAPHLYARGGNPYVGYDGRDWPDNAVRFAALSAVGAFVGGGHLPAFVPDVVHAHDWQAGLTAAYLYYGGGRRPPTVMTVHNLAFQGQFPAEMFGALGLPPHAMSVEGVEYYGMIGFLKAGLRLSDRITTVSPTYAAEIRTPEGGMGLDGLLRTRARVVSGIVNGIDDVLWSPERDPMIKRNFDASTIDLRLDNKIALQARLGLEADPNALLFAVVSRLTWQKGLDMLLGCVGAVTSLGAQLVVLGAGDRDLEAGFRDAARAHPGRIATVIGYDEGLAHQIQAGADALLVPSRFEPCGLTQLSATRYGALPIVARVGGLADTVIDANEMARAQGLGTGFQFSPVSRDMLEAAMLRAADLWQDKAAWRQLQMNALATDVSWRGPARRYADLYRALVTAPGGF
ncbi:starch synthase [Pseudoxanthobacter soli DSM 19599]|uniref:Glycogen synthase n=1 Tax=Pseudoxanthobacter soli DSM 19599 TaxID=1123029 RepID=A0A1M7Z4T4_9HYPH|nr:starch synthase [Pseudoxanthobacter soli DSM 19599]